MISNSEFESAVREAFAFIAAGGPPRVVDPAEQSQSFGNNFMSLEGDKLRVRVTLDRGQYLVSLSPLVPDWFDLDVVLQHVAGIEPVERDVPNALLSLSMQAEQIKRHFAAIDRAFHPDNWAHTRLSLSALQDARARRYFANSLLKPL